MRGSEEMSEHEEGRRERGRKMKEHDGAGRGRCKVVGKEMKEYGEGGDEGERSVKDKGGGGGRSEKERASEEGEQR